MKTYEGTMLIRWGKNLTPSIRPITIDCDSHSQLLEEQKRIKTKFLTEGEDSEVSATFGTQRYVGVQAYGVWFYMSERK